MNNILGTYTLTASKMQIEEEDISRETGFRRLREEVVMQNRQSDAENTLENYYEMNYIRKN